jgi:hypothetical protein
VTQAGKHKHLKEVVGRHRVEGLSKRKPFFEKSANFAKLKGEVKLIYGNL